MDHSVRKWLLRFDEHVADADGRVILLIVCQLAFIGALAYELFTNSAYTETYTEYPDDTFVVVCRFFCAALLHVKLTQEVDQAFGMIRYSLNHGWKFNRPIAAFMVGLSQLAVAVGIEGVNLIILLTNTSLVETMLSFLALLVISELGTFFFSMVRETPLGRLISDG